MQNISIAWWELPYLRTRALWENWEHASLCHPIFITQLLCFLTWASVVARRAISEMDFLLDEPSGDMSSDVFKLLSAAWVTTRIKRKCVRCASKIIYETRGNKNCIAAGEKHRCKLEKQSCWRSDVTSGDSDLAAVVPTTTLANAPVPKGVFSRFLGNKLGTWVGF